jgi:hypothetical protein
MWLNVLLASKARGTLANTIFPYSLFVDARVPVAIAVMNNERDMRPRHPLGLSQ